MMKQTFSRSTAVLGLAVLVWSATTMAQAPAADPWTRVPAAPTGCYRSDNFETRIDAARAPVEAERVKQDELNKQIQGRFTSMSPTEQMVKMQEFMMKNPEEAMKVMQAMQTAGQNVSTTIVSGANEVGKLETELETLRTSFTSTIDKAVKPLEAKQAALITNANTEPVGEAGGFRFKTAALEAQYAALVKELNAEYEKTCSSFYGPAGQFTKWFAAYKTYLINSKIASEEEMAKTSELQFMIFNTPTGGYRSTAKLAAVRMYMDKMRTIYGYRWGTPRAGQHTPR
jgi:hypothetical protein